MPSRWEVIEMFYVKEKLSEAAEVRVEIHDDNVYCTCPGCGCEVQVDLIDVLCNDQGDLYSTSVYCTDCSMERLEELMR